MGLRFRYRLGYVRFRVRVGGVGTRGSDFGCKVWDTRVRAADFWGAGLLSVADWQGRLLQCSIFALSTRV